MSTTDASLPVSPANRQKVVDFAKAQVGKPYLFAGAGPDSFDCSGLVLAAWRQAGLVLPHQSGQQVKALRAVPFSIANRRKLRPGDVVFYYGSISNPASVTHCALYVERDTHGLRQVVAAVDDAHGVMEHWIAWALQPCGFGYVGHA